MSKRKQAGRNARKRFIRMAADGQLESYSEVGEPKSKEQLIEVHRQCGQLIAQQRERLLQSYRLELQKRATLLGAKGCWEFYHTTLPEARQWGLEHQLRKAVALFAARFVAAGTGNVHFAS